MNIAILAAGYGTRLYPLTSELPKPLLPINDTPVINFIVEKFAPLQKNNFIKDIYVVTNNKFYNEFIRWKEKYGYKTVILNDGSNSPQDRLGAVGDINVAIGQNKKCDWLILGGDNLFDDDLRGVLRNARACKPHPLVGLYDVKDKGICHRYGIVKLNSRKRIIQFQEKPRHPASTLVATCVYSFPKESVKFLDIYLNENRQADASGKYISWLLSKDNVFGYILKGKWIDIGHPDSLRQAEQEFSRGSNVCNEAAGSLRQ